MKAERGSVVVIGGGYAGTTVARALDNVADVTLVDRKDAFFHRIAALRAAVHPLWVRAPFMSYDQLLTHGRFAHGTAMALDPDRGLVILESGDSLSYDAVVIATGSEAQAPARFIGTTTDEALSAMRDYQCRIADASKVVVVGGGPVGVELAGEVRAVHPNKPITLIQGADTLLPGSHTPRFGERARAELDRQGISVRLGQAFDPDVADNGNVLWAVGAKPNTGWLREARGEPLTDSGHLRVDSQLRVEGWENVFAIGDAADADSAKLVLPAVAQAKVVARNVRLLLAGRTPANTYRPSSMQTMVVPIGPRHGVSLLQDVIVGSTITRALKGRHLFVRKFRESLGLGEVSHGAHRLTESATTIVPSLIARPH